MDDISRAERFKRRCGHLVNAGKISLKKRGARETLKKMLTLFSSAVGIGSRISYWRWSKTPLYSEAQLEAQRKQIFEKEIKFSIITPLFNTPEEYLKDMLDSVLEQTYSDWELCLADGSDKEHRYVREICLRYAAKDSRIRYKKIEKNFGIAGNSNACIDMSTGEYLCILDHDDVLHPAALHDVMEIICRKDADLIYTDEATFRSPDIKDIALIHFKPDYAPDNLRANNYICHFMSFSRTLIEECGAFREGYDGSQDHELTLRLTKNARRIEHIPEVLYYWRSHNGSTAEAEDNKAYAAEAGVRAVRDNLKASGIEASVESVKRGVALYRISYKLKKPLPKVSIIIPNCDHADDLRTCLNSIRKKTTYPNYEVIVVENNSTGADVFAYYKELTASLDERIKIIEWSGKGFNWAAINNYAVREESTGEYLILLNNDTEVIAPDWVEQMLMYSQRSDVGITGAMLYYPDDTIQHAGVTLGLGDAVGHTFYHVRRGEPGYMRRLQYAQNVSAVTGACMMIRRDVFEEVGGIDELYAVDLNDIDLCMRVRKNGYLIVWTPYAELYHFESKSRGLTHDTDEEAAQANRELEMFRTRWADELAAGDPYYNPNLSCKRSFAL